MIVVLDPEQMPRIPFWEQVLNDLTSRGSLAGGIALLYAIITVGWWLVHVGLVRFRSEAIPIRVLIAGTRGKSSVVRLLHAAFTQAGLLVQAKTTGTAARVIESDGAEHTTRRLGQVSILEMLPAVHHAGRRHVDVFVGESMAVNPKLIRQTSKDIVRPTVVAITNSDLDHLEEEGSDRLSIMGSLSQAVTGEQIVVTTERDPLCVWKLQQRVETHEGTLLAVDRRLAMDGEGRPLVHDAYPENVALSLGVTRACDIPDAVALEGMRHASHEPEAEECFQGSMGGLDMTFWNFGSINDANNVLPAVVRAAGEHRPGTPRLALLSGRYDRPLRALVFAGLVPPSLFDGVVITSGPEVMVRQELLRSGWTSQQVLSLGLSAYSQRMAAARIVQLVREIENSARGFELIALENIHVPFTSTLRRRLMSSSERT